jgi:hypothetical protein
MSGILKSMSSEPDLLERAKDVLVLNDRGAYTIPAHGLYPHQWLWDSCFVAIGLRHIDVERAKMEILNLLRGQWSNGMIPHMIFTPDRAYRRDHNIWRSWVSPFAPDDIITSGITQPPMLAEAVVKIGEEMLLPERRSWYRLIFPALLAHHEWLYRERDPHGEGLVLQIHPWETGLDNSPPWMSELHQHLLPWWIRALEKTKLDFVAGLFRRDTQHVPLEQRYSNIDAMALYAAQKRLRRKEYNIDKILDHSLFTIEDLAFNCILIRNNEHLVQIARSLRIAMPPELVARMELTKQSLEELWDPYTEQYYPRDFITHKLIKEPSIASLLPLYTGCISKERAEILVRSIENPHMFGPAYPIPSTPLNSPWFNPQRYWQGPMWVNMNWLIADGLKRYGFKDHAGALVEGTLEVIDHHSISEYYNPITGEALGAPNFSWTAALAIDWLKG